MKKYILTAFLAGACALGAGAADSNNLKVYINPGHGGHESNDRNVVIAPYAQGDPNGYWESNSNLDKGLALRDMLEAKGYKVEMSRVTNTEDDDLGLSTIVRLANKSNADLFFSIHSNATGTSARRNFPLMLYRGYDNDPENPKSIVIAEMLNKQLLENQATYWTGTNLNMRGDWSFYHSWGDKVGLGVLRGLTIVGMLSEGSFHDYIPEAYRLMNKDFCWLEAWHFRKATDEFFSQPGVDYGAVIGRLNDTRVLRDGTYVKFGDDRFATIQSAKVDLYNEAGTLVGTYTTDPININGIFCFRNLAPGKYTVKASEDTHYPVEMELEVKPNEVSYANMQMSKVRSTPPVVEAVTPVWKEGDEPVLCNTPVTVQFNWDMDTELTEKAITITPAAEGTITWEDLNYRMVFTPTKAYETNTLYTFTVSTEATHAGGMKMEKPYSFTFKTTDRNFMDVLGQFPKENEEIHYKNAAVELRFDKYPNVTPILNQITCKDDAGNTVAFNRRGMTNSKAGAPYGFVRIPFAKDLVPGQTYHLSVSGQVSDKDGITIQKPIEVSFKAVDAGEEKNYAVVEDFEKGDAFAFDEEQSLMVKSNSCATDSKLKLFGAGCVGFTYAFEATEGGEALWTRVPAADEKVFVNTDKICVHVDGDLSGNELYLMFSSELGIIYVPVTTLDFLGWRYIEQPLSMLEGGGKYTFTGVKVVQVAGQASVGGTIRVDNFLDMGAGAGIENVEIESLTVYPNPASEYLIANAGVVIESVSLVNMAGATVAVAGGNVLNVSEVAEGAYLAVIRTASGSAVRKVVVKH